MITKKLKGPLIKKKEAHPSGQSLIEALVISLVLIAMFQLVFFVFWIGTNILWLEHQLYQGMICTAQGKSIHFCERKALKEIQKLKSGGKVHSLKIRGFENKWKGELLWQFYKKNFFIKQNLLLKK